MGRAIRNGLIAPALLLDAVIAGIVVAVWKLA